MHQRVQVVRYAYYFIYIHLHKRNLVNTYCGHTTKELKIVTWLRGAHRDVDAFGKSHVDYGPLGTVYGALSQGCYKWLVWLEQ